MSHKPLKTQQSGINAGTEDATKWNERLLPAILCIMDMTSSDKKKYTTLISEVGVFMFLFFITDFRN